MYQTITHRKYHHSILLPKPYLFLIYELVANHKHFLYTQSMSKKILIVDDDLFIRELYEEVLISEGYEVETASDGKDGLDKILNNSYLLILLDVMLPLVDGLGILTVLEEKGKLKETAPIILLTNLAHDPIVKEAVNKGAHTVFIKTDITPDQLLEYIKKLLGGEKKAEAPATTIETPTATPAVATSEVAAPTAEDQTETVETLDS